MAIENELLDQLLAGRELGDVFGKDGLFDDLKKALSERILNAELDDHLDGERTEGHANRRNGTSKKSVLTGTSKVTLSVPRDRAGIPVPVVAAPWSSSRPSYPDTPRALPHDRSPGEHAHDDDPHPSPAPGRPRRPVADLTEIPAQPARGGVQTSTQGTNNIAPCGADPYNRRHRDSPSPISTQDPAVKSP